MSARASVALVLALASLAACRTTGDDTAAGTPDPAARPGELRATCEPGGSIDGFDPCGTKHRVSLVFANRSLERGENPSVKAPCPTQRSVPAGAATVITSCFQDGALYASGNCAMCRVPGTGWNAVALVDELTDAQAFALQSRIGVASSTPLHGEKAWRAALSGRTARRDDGQAGAVASR